MGGVAAVNAALVIAPKHVDEALGHAVALWLQTGAWIGLQPSERVMSCVSFGAAY